MRFISLYFSLLMAWSCWAQPAPINRRAFALAGLASATQPPPTPSNIGGNLRFYWNYNDLTVGVTVSNQWFDRVISERLWQMDNTKSPTNSALGVRFNGSPFYLTNRVFNWCDAGNNTGTVFVIMSPATPATTFGGIICGQDSSGRGLYITSGNKLRVFGSVASPTFCDVVSGTLMDLTITTTNNGGQGAGNSVSFYTNGVLISSGNNVQLNDVLNVGADNAASKNYMKGTIREMAWYSNVLSTLQISNLHYYRTNLYGGTP